MEEGGPPRRGAAIQWVGACFLQAAHKDRQDKHLEEAYKKALGAPQTSL